MHISLRDWGAIAIQKAANSFLQIHGMAALKVCGSSSISIFSGSMLVYPVHTTNNYAPTTFIHVYFEKYCPSDPLISESKHETNNTKEQTNDKANDTPETLLYPI